MIVSSLFSMIKNITAPLSRSRFPIKLICCFIYLFSNSITTVVCYLNNFFVSFFYIFYRQLEKCITINKNILIFYFYTWHIICIVRSSVIFIFERYDKESVNITKLNICFIVFILIRHL